jgi:glycosyltransferase involved in cell wall biosynthesis
MTVAISPAHRQALAAMDAEEFAAAAKLLAEPARAEDDWPAQNDLALCHFMRGDTGGALALLDRILVRDPGNSFAIINLFYLIAAHEVRHAAKPDPKAKIQDLRGDGPATPLITVVMPTFSRPEEIRESIDSVRAQTLADWELIVVNDGGGHEVEATMAGYLADPRVRYVYAAHGGLSSARNVGMALARGTYITQLDDDDVFYPPHLATVAAAFRADPARRVVYTDFYRAYQDEREGRWVTVRRALDYSNDFSRALLRTGTIAPVCNVTHHREALSAVGYYNEQILRAMDWEYFIRLAHVYDFHHVPEITGEFRQKSDRSQMTRSFAIPRNHYRNLVSFLHGYFPLTAARLLDSPQGRGDRLKSALDRLLAADADRFLLQRLELRKLLIEPYYALFYTLGKRLADEGQPQPARAAFRAAVAMRPYEIKAWLKFIKPA